MKLQNKKQRTVGENVLMSNIGLSLRCLIAVSEGLCFLSEKPYRQGIIISEGWEGLVGYDRMKIEKAARARMRDLRHRGFVETQKIGGRLVFALTDKGSGYLLRKRLRVASKCARGEQVWVTYDIPRAQNAARDALRYFLKSNDFFRIQHSVWACDRDVYVPLRDFVRDHKLGKWVDIVVTKNMVGK